MRRRARTDRNQTEIVKALRAFGCSVAILSEVGGGVPDLLVGRGRRNLLLEVKDGMAKDKRQRELTEDEERFHAGWRGQVAIAMSVDDALNVVRAAIGPRSVA